MRVHETHACQREDGVRPAVDPYFALLSAALAWIAAAYRVGPASVWESDYRVVQCLTGQAVGWDGIATAALARGFRLLPFGTVTTRLGLLSSAACAIACLYVYRLSFWALSHRTRSSTLAAWLSLGTACLFALSPSTTQAASLPSSAFASIALVAAAVHAALCLSARQSTSDSRFSGHFVLGLLIAITTLERFWAGAVAALIVLLIALTQSYRWSRADVRSMFFGTASTFCALGLPWLITRRVAQSQSLLSHELVSQTPQSDASLLLNLADPLLSDLGPTVLFLSLIGAISCALAPQKWTQLWVFGLVLPVTATLLFGGRLVGIETRRGLLLLSEIGLLILSARGLFQIISWASRTRINRTALIGSLAVIGQVTIALAHGDEASFRADRYRTLGAEVLTDEALLALPGRSVLLLRHGELYRRFAAAMHTDFLRPDLLLVSLDAAIKPAVVGELLRHERALSPVLRDLAISGRPSEFALSTLADARPVYVEFDAQWDPRLREHLLPMPLLSRLTSQAVGRSERAQLVDDSQQQMIRIFRATLLPGTNAGEEGSLAPLEVTTRTVFRARVQEQLTLLLSLGDRQSFDALFADYEDFEPNCPWASALRPRLQRSTRAISAFDLLTSSQTESVQSTNNPRQK